MSASRPPIQSPIWRRILILWFPAIAWMIVLFVLSAQSSLPSVASTVSDKVEHGGAYAVLGVLMLRALASGTWRGVTLKGVALAVLLATAYGITDELHQLFVPDRSFDLLDMAADAAGAAAGAGVVWAWGIIRRRSTLR